MIHKDFCPTCGGMGHVPDCDCSGGVAFVMGCCTKCGGEGYVTVKPNGLVDQHGRPLKVVASDGLEPPTS
jgi:hypothetical protein